MAGSADFEPLYPEERAIDELREPASVLLAECRKLAGRARQPVLRALRTNLRAMNSYYTNKIEGQHTRPADIERALRKQFDADSALAAKQRLAVAHMEVEEEVEAAYVQTDPRELFSPEVVQRVHALLYGRLPEVDRRTEDGSAIVPGEFRSKDVIVGRHVPPPCKDVPALMKAWSDRYLQLAGDESLLIGLACSHQRLAWVHPFIDGNGRAARLHSHLVLHAMRLTNGIWSCMRGLARTQEQYYSCLHNADLPRRNDFDGRGALSQEELVAFVRYFLEMCLDQAGFMQEQIDLDSLRNRLKDLLRHLEECPWQVGSEKSVIKIEALEPLHYVAIAGPVERSRFISMIGLGERTGRRVMASLLDYGVLRADAPRAPVEFSVPMKSLRFLFPRLWPEAEADTA